MTQPLLIEIGVEELPAVPLLKIVKNIEHSWKKILTAYRLESDFEFLYTPRRLVIRAEAMPLKQTDSIIELMGPPVQAAVRDGEVTQAGQGFAKKCGVAFEDLGRADNNGREVLYYKKEEQGQQTAALLQEMLEQWLSSMAFGKMMRWGNRSDEFIRPIRWLQVRLGDESIPVKLFGVKAGTKTYVHRMVNSEAIAIYTNIDNNNDNKNIIKKHEDILLKGAVILFPQLRKKKILKEFEILEEKYQVTIEKDKKLLDEVVAITEYPKALIGSFDKLFLELPSEVIITSMKEHQRYFPIFKNGKLTNKFIVVSNAVPQNNENNNYRYIMPSEITHDIYFDDVLNYDKVISGNERVLKPRLEDGLFFYHNDLKNKLSTDGLERAQFIDGLGTLADKIDREKVIAKYLLEKYKHVLMNETNRNYKELQDLMGEAIGLAKADLMSEMVYEFTELQGLMGYYYAKAEGKDLLVCNAIKEQYMPVGEGAELPSSIFSSIVAMSVKLDTLFGLFSVGKIPTGSKDPFALRRAVNGIIRIVLKYNLEFDPGSDEIFEFLNKNYTIFKHDLLKDFFNERIKKSLDANASVIASVLATGRTDILEIDKIVFALNEIVNSDGFRERFSTFKRVANISKDINLDDTFVSIELLVNEEEKDLFNAHQKVIERSYPNYKSELEALFSLKPQLDTFFDNVMVHVEDNALRENRLKLIGSIYESFKKIADIKEITV